MQKTCLTSEQTYTRIEQLRKLKSKSKNPELIQAKIDKLWFDLKNANKFEWLAR